MAGSLDFFCIHVDECPVLCLSHEMGAIITQCPLMPGWRVKQVAKLCPSS